MVHDKAGNEIADKAEPSLCAKVAFLSSTAAYEGVDTVDTRETHMAWVFLAGDRAYKMKKPVQNPLLDYGTIDARHYICGEEVRLNRRLAPDVYLDMVRLSVDADGTLAINGEGRTVDWLVEMRRLPEELLLDHAIRADAASHGAIEAVANLLARFYREAPVVDVDPDAHVAQFMRELGKNRDVFSERQFNSHTERGNAIVARLENILTHRPELVAERAAAGRIVEGHGDLRPEHVCLTDPPVIIDCLEFSRDLRLVDPFDELAFLSMECAVLGAGWIGPIVVNRCATMLGDRPLDELFAFYTAYRGTLRARLALAHLLEPMPRTPEKWKPLAQAYLDEAERAVVRLRPPADRPATRSDGAD